MKNHFVDTNVLLEILLPERTASGAAERTIDSLSGATISPLTAHLYVHFGCKAKLPLDQLLEHIQSYRLTSMSSAEIQWAIDNRQDDDFEDALQVACAVLDGCSNFITLDQKLAKNYDRFIDIQLLK